MAGIVEEDLVSNIADSDYIAGLEQFLQRKEDKVNECLAALGWSKHYLESNVSNMVQCPLNSGHWVPGNKLSAHVEACELRRKHGVDLSGYDSPVDTSFFYEGRPGVVQVHVDDTCWNALDSKDPKQARPKQFPNVSENSDSPAVWLDLSNYNPPPPPSPVTQVGVAGGVASTDESAVKLQVVQHEGNVLRLAPTGSEDKSQSRGVGIGCGSVNPRDSQDSLPPVATSVPVEYDLVSRSVGARRLMYDNVIAAAKSVCIPTASSDTMTDKDLVRDDYRSVAKALKQASGESLEAQTLHERLAVERNKKRRRQRYKAKNIANNQSLKEIYRAIIKKRMAELGHLDPPEARQPELTSRPGTERAGSMQGANHQERWESTDKERNTSASATRIYSELDRPHSQRNASHSRGQSESHLHKEYSSTDNERGKEDKRRTEHSGRKRSRRDVAELPPKRSKTDHSPRPSRHDKEGESFSLEQNQDRHKHSHKKKHKKHKKHDHH